MRFLFATFEGGGHVPPAIEVARALQARGHQVLLLSDEANRVAAARARLRFTTWRRAPNRQAAGRRDDPLDDWRTRWPPGVVRRICNAVICGPAAAYAADTLDAVAEFNPDAVVSNELLFGVMAAAQKSDTPLALLSANIWCFPTRNEVPPFGPCFAPAATRAQQRRDAFARGMIARWYDAGLNPLNAARGALGLAPLARALQQLDAARLVILGTCRSFDYGAEASPPFLYAGALTATPAFAAGVSSPRLDRTCPNVLISLSTTFQHQAGALARCVRALAPLPLRGIVTLGPALAREIIPCSDNVSIVAAADHDVLMPQCRAMICHGGHGTLLRALLHGLPVLCLPSMRDQGENAKRLVWSGAGLSVPPRASPRRIRAALIELLRNPDYALRAQALASSLRQESDGGERAAAALERFAAQRNRISCAAPV